MDYFSLTRDDIKKLACPACAKKDSPLTLIKDGDEFTLHCKECSTAYDIKDVVYFTEDCNPKKCALECAKACPVNAFYFKRILPGVKSKRIHINDSCIHCGKCADACPMDGLVKVKTPVLYPKGKTDFAKKIKGLGEYEGGIPQVMGEIRPLDESNLVPSTRLTFEYLAGQAGKNDKGGFFLDDGCGSQNFKAFLESRLDVDVFGVDVRADHYAYYPIGVLCEGESLPLESDCALTVTSNFVLEHARDPKAYISELGRIMSRDGIAFVSVPTPAYHIAYFLCITSYLQYLLNIIQNPLKFIKNPLKHFLTQRAHEKDWSTDSRENITFIDEMMRWRRERWVKLFEESGLDVAEEKVKGGLLSLNRGLSKKIGDSIRRGVHRTFSIRRA